MFWWFVNKIRLTFLHLSRKRMRLQLILYSTTLMFLLPAIWRVWMYICWRSGSYIMSVWQSLAQFCGGQHPFFFYAAQYGILFASFFCEPSTNTAFYRKRLCLCWLACCSCLLHHSLSGLAALICSLTLHLLRPFYLCSIIRAQQLFAPTAYGWDKAGGAQQSFI